MLIENVEAGSAAADCDEMDNMNFFEFSGPLLSRISVWMAHPENSLK